MRPGAAWLALVLAACGGVSTATDGGGGDGGGDGGGADAVGSGAPSKLDILFVIDNSATMVEEQSALVAAFPTFIEALEGVGELPSLHIGIVTSDMGVGGITSAVPQCTPLGDGGVLQNTPFDLTCSGPIDRYIRDEPDPQMPGQRLTNYAGGDLAATFGCIARVGSMGCGFEQHLNAMRKALDGTVLENAGFVRPDAKLAIVIVADEDDCSASDPAIYVRENEPQFGPFNSFRCTEFGVECGGLPVTREPATYTDCKASTTSAYLPHTRVFADAVRAVKPNPEDVLFAAIVGDPTPFQTGPDPLSGAFSLLPSCTVASGTSYPGARFESMRAEFGDRGFRASICANDLTPAMQGVAAFIATQLE